MRNKPTKRSGGAGDQVGKEKTAIGWSDKLLAQPKKEQQQSEVTNHSVCRRKTFAQKDTMIVKQRGTPVAWIVEEV